MTLAISLTQHPSPALVAMGFSIMLVLSLVAVEEAEMRRPAARPADEFKR